MPRPWPLLVLLLAAPAGAEEATVRAERPAADGQSKTKVDLAPRRLETLHLGDLVGRTPGALALDFGGVLATTTLSLRGGNADQAAILLDGVPLGSPAGGGLDVSLVPAALLEGVSIARGSDGRVGAGAMGGAVELVPAASTRAVLTAGSLGTFGASGSFAKELASAESVWKLAAAADVRRSKGDFTYHRDPTPEIAGNDVPVTLDRRNNDATLGSLLLRAERKTPDHAISGLLFGTWSTRGLPGPIYSTSPGSRQDEKNLTAQVAFHSDILTLPLSARVGLLQTHDGLISSGEQHFVDVALRPAYRRPVGELVFGIDALFGREDFVGTQHGNHERLRVGVAAGVAKEKGVVAGDLSMRVETWGDEFAFLPRLGLNAKAGRGLFVYGNLGLGFRPPSFGELYYAAGPVLPNPDLKPEDSMNADVGARLERPSGDVTFSLGVDAFATRYSHVIVYELYSGSRAKPFNLGSARALGAEAEASVKLAGGLSAGLSATLLQTTNLVEGVNTYGLALPYRPATRASVRADYERDRLRAGVGLDWTGAAAANRANTRTIASFLDLHGTAGVRLAGDLWASAEVRNALDVTDRACLEGYPLPGRVVLAHLAWMPGETP